MSFRYIIGFSKKSLMAYISHLDLVRLFPRAIRRAGLSAEVTRGFSPRIKISFRRALKLGQESEREEFAIALHDNLAPEEVKKRLQSQLPEGILLLDVRQGG